MKLTAIVGLPVITEEGEKVGYVLGVCLGKGKKVFLRCADGEEREFCIQAEEVAGKGDLLLWSGKGRVGVRTVTCSLGKSCYNKRGKYLGKLSDLEWQNGTFVTAYVGGNAVDFALVTWGDILLVKEKKEKEERKVAFPVLPPPLVAVLTLQECERSL